MSDSHEQTDSHNSPRRRIPEVLLNNPEALQKPKELLFLEIGAASSAGFSPYHLAYDGATIVTVNAPYGVDRGDTLLIWDTSPEKSDYSLTGNRRLAKNLQEKIEKRGESEYPYTFVPIVGDGRDMHYFDDGTFGKVMLHNVISDPSISSDNAARLMTEALRVGDEVELWENMTGFATKWRLDYANLEEAGIVCDVTWPLDREHGDSMRVTLTKADHFGQVPLVLPEETPMYHHIYERQQAEIIDQAHREAIAEQYARDRDARREKRRHKRAAILAKFGISNTRK